MEGEACKGCGSRDLEMDPIAGFLACLSCGLVNEETRLEWHGDGGQFKGTFVAVSDTGVFAASAGNGYSRRWSHVKHGFIKGDDGRKITVLKRLNYLSSYLRLPKEKVDEVKHIVEYVTEGHWAQGAWTDILIGSCIYVVARQSCFPLTIVEVAEAIQHDVTEVARMFNKIIDVMDIKIPQIDPNSFLERAIFTFPPFGKLQKDMLRKLFKEGQLLLQYALRWFLTTGRHLLPVLAAIIVIVAEANEVNVGLDELSLMLRINTVTARSRLKEFREDLVINVGSNLPWGKDITLKTLNRHMPFVMQYLELKLKLQQKETALSYTEKSQEREQIGISTASAEVVKLSSQNTQGCADGNVGAKRCKIDRFDKDDHLGVTHGSNAKVSSINNENSNEDEGHECEKIHDSTAEQVKNKSLVAFECVPNSDVLSKNHWHALPPAFRASELARLRRHGKINAAKKRIAKVRQAITNMSTEQSPVMHTNYDGSRSNFTTASCQEPDIRLDWEDLMIEYLVLHGADEGQIEDGYYRTLLSLPPVQKETEITDKSLQQYIRSETEIAFLQSILPEEPVNPFVMPHDV